MPSHSSETLRCESYSTPRSVGVDGSLGKEVTKDPDEETDHTVIPSARGVKNRDGVHSAPSHFSPQISQNLTERLLDNSEQCSLEDCVVFESSVLDDWSEATSGWRVVAPYPKYITHQPPSRHKSESALKKARVSSRTAVRCVDDDFSGEQLCPAWKGNVEPVTYRYVPNNGYYRSHKSSRDMREWLTVKKNKSGKCVVTPEIRQVQKTLKRDLEYHLFKVPNEENTAAVENTTAVQYQEPTVTPVQAQGDQKDRSHYFTHTSKRLPAREQQLIKSASDLFMENFNTRINALEKEIHTPYAPAVGKKLKESTLNHSPTQITKKLKEVRIPDTMKPTIQSTKQHSGNFGQDLFTIIPMCKREAPLRPLEKLTPKQKQMGKHSSREMSPSQDVQFQQEEEEEEEEDMMIMLAAATSHPPPLPKDADSGSSNTGINTARSAIAMTNFDIEKMRNVPLRTEFGGKPKSFVVRKGSGPVTLRGGAMHYSVTNSNGRTPELAASADEEISTENFTPPIERHIGKKMDSMAPTLPEIMGKRLTVTTTTHRLL